MNTGGKMKRFIYEKLLKFVEFLITKFEIDEKEILNRYQRLKNKEVKKKHVSNKRLEKSSVRSV